MEIGLYYPPLVGSAKEIKQGMAGQRTDLYQRMLKNLLEMAQYADATGYYGFGFSEHHLCIEGITMSDRTRSKGIVVPSRTASAESTDVSTV